MSYGKMQAALNQYQQVGTDATVAAATPHQLIQMLLGGALDRIAAARGHLQRGNLAEKGAAIGKAVAIVVGLRKSLNTKAGGEIAGNLESLYEYLERRLFEANVKNDAAILDEATRLIGDIKDGWDAIPANVR